MASKRFLKTVMAFILIGDESCSGLFLSIYVKLQQVDGRGYSSIHSIRGVLSPAFQMAVDDDLIRKNPFGQARKEVDKVSGTKTMKQTMFKAI